VIGEIAQDTGDVPIYTVARKFADMFEADNPAFNRSKFNLRAFAHDPNLRKVVPRKTATFDGTEGQDRESYSDTQDRDSYASEEVRK
jgi:hypothetical protein